MNNLLQEKIEAFDVISFDMFDTLLHRQLNYPQDLHELTQLSIRHHPISKKYPILGQSYSVNRLQAERVARNERLKYHEDSEVTLEEIYEVLGEILGIHQKDLDILLNLEIHSELLVLHPNKDMKEAYTYAQGLNKKVIITSDMYLQEAQLRNILICLDFDVTNVDIYSSCDYRQSKALGTLYDNILTSFKDKKVLHIGDNEVSDKENAEKKGINAYLYEFQPIKDLFLYDSSITTSLVLGTIKKVYKENKERSFYNQLGINVFGPLVTGYIIWLLSKLCHSDYDKILFFARDGFIPFQLINKHLIDCEDSTSRVFTDLPPIHYVHISRCSSTLPTLFDFDIKKASRIIAGQEPRQIGEWLKLYGISDANQYIGQLQAAGFESSSSIASSKDERIPFLLGLLSTIIQSTLHEETENALRYFNTFKGEKLAIVDIGWYGSLQQNLSKLFNLENPCTIDGYYFSLWTHETFSRESLHDRYFSYLQEYKASLYANIPQLLQDGGASILEWGLSATQGTTLGYINGTPDFEEVVSSVTIEAAKEVQRGIEEFFETIVPFIKKLTPRTLSSLDWSRSFFRMIEFPALEEAENLGDLYHSDSAGSLSDILIPFAPRISKDALNNKEEYKNILNRVFWRQAFNLRNNITKSRTKE